VLPLPGLDDAAARTRLTALGPESMDADLGDKLRGDFSVVAANPLYEKAYTTPLKKTQAMENVMSTRAEAASVAEPPDCPWRYCRQR
jgi:hypothetical protein